MCARQRSPGSLHHRPRICTRALQMEANQWPRILFGFPEWRLEYWNLAASWPSRCMFQPSFARSPTSSAVRLAADCWSRQRRVVQWRGFQVPEVRHSLLMRFHALLLRRFTSWPYMKCITALLYRTRLGRLCSCEADSPRFSLSESDLVALIL